MSYSEWSNFAYYKVGDIATYNTIAYQALQPNQNVPPLPANPSWQVLPSGGGAGVSSLSGLTGVITQSVVSGGSYANVGNDIQLTLNPISAVESLNGLIGNLTLVGGADQTHSPSIIVDTAGNEVAIYTRVLSQHGVENVSLTGTTTQITITLPEAYSDASYSVLTTIGDDNQQDAPIWVNIGEKNGKDFSCYVNSTDPNPREITLNWGTLGVNPPP